MPTVATLRSVVLIGLFVALSTGGCSKAAPSQEATTYPDVGIDLTSTVDPVSGAIVFPYDRLTPSEEESALMFAAEDVLIARCAQERGVDWRAVPVSTYSTLYDSSIYFGVWTEGQANRFAFTLPSTNADLVANGAVEPGALEVHLGTPEQPDLSGIRAVLEHNSTVSEADREVVTECGQSPEIERISGLELFSGPWNSKLSVAMQSFDTLPEVEAIYAELDTCLAEAGLTPDPDSPGHPLGAEVDRIDEEQIRMALQVVECKSQIDFVPRLADLEAQLEAPVLVEYADELLEARADTDALVAEARAVLASAQTER